MRYMMPHFMLQNTKDTKYCMTDSDSGCCLFAVAMT